MSPRTPESGRAGRGCLAAWRRAAIVALVLLALASGAAAGEQWGWLGVRIRDLTEQEMEEITKKVGVSEGYGVLIAQVMKETPAAASGLREGDLVVAIDGRPIVETRVLQKLVGATAAGRELAVVVLREGSRQEVRIRVGRMPADVVADRVALEFGFYVRDPQAGVSHAIGLLVLTLSGSRICAMTRFDNSVLPRFGLPRTLPE